MKKTSTKCVTLPYIWNITNTTEFYGNTTPGQPTDYIKTIRLLVRSLRDRLPIEEHGDIQGTLWWLQQFLHQPITLWHKSGKSRKTSALAHHTTTTRHNIDFNQQTAGYHRTVTETQHKRGYKDCNHHQQTNQYLTDTSLATNQ